jgi:hypothetical protein
MEFSYKEHRIQVTVWEESIGGWLANIYISYQQGLQSRLITFMLNQTWPTYSEALEAGLAIAKRWIDDGRA